MPAFVGAVEAAVHLGRTLRWRWLQDVRTEMELAHEEACWDFRLPVERRRHQRVLELVCGRRPDLSRLRVLEAGCAAGDFTVLLAEACGDVLAIDVAQRACELTRQALAGRGNVQVDRLDLSSLARVGEFDVVFLLDTLECLPGRGAMAPAICRAVAALKAGGLLALSCCKLPPVLEGRWWTAALGQGAAGTLRLVATCANLRLVASETYPLTDTLAPAYPDHLLALWEKAPCP